ncbi:urease accessory protein UreD [Nakamurella sp. PAMC28650]|uniref:urease accessory protein UreD n=1 Tax=Nakamurella sp. PAMC28650 TaxID=2762325 RepID=UPI00164D81FE|nr:urease accessory protein UreD [Nakamurella sp. PAMC28650]QNK81650.1 urease accessory protein UreD [Nakamurella sp. PAMC28650]
MTRVAVRVDGGRARLELIGGNLAPRLISADDGGAKVALVATSALLLGGDAVDLELRVGAGAWLEIVETAGTVAYDAEGEQSRWNVRAVVEAGGLLLWHGEPLVISDGANTLRSSRYALGDEAVVCVRETVVLGRSGERGGALRVQNQVAVGGTSVLAEDLDLSSCESRELPGILGRASVVDTVTLIGTVPPGFPPLFAGSLFRLGGGAGTIGRVLRTDLAGSPARAWWSSWSAAARDVHAARRAVGISGRG